MIGTYWLAISVSFKIWLLLSQVPTSKWEIVTFT